MLHVSNLLLKKKKNPKLSDFIPANKNFKNTHVSCFSKLSLFYLQFCESSHKYKGTRQLSCTVLMRQDYEVHHPTPGFLPAWHLITRVLLAFTYDSRRVIQSSINCSRKGNISSYYLGRLAVLFFLYLILYGGITRDFCSVSEEVTKAQIQRDCRGTQNNTVHSPPLAMSEDNCALLSLLLSPFIMTL